MCVRWTRGSACPKAIAQDNPLGHQLFKNQISKVISKPSQAELEAIFQDGDTGRSSYQPSQGTTTKPDSDNNLLEGDGHEVHAGAKRKN